MTQMIDRRLVMGDNNCEQLCLLVISSCTMIFTAVDFFHSFFESLEPRTQGKTSRDEERDRGLVRSTWCLIIIFWYRWTCLTRSVKTYVGDGIRESSAIYILKKSLRPEHTQQLKPSTYSYSITMVVLSSSYTNSVNETLERGFDTWSTHRVLFLIFVLIAFQVSIWFVFYLCALLVTAAFFTSFLFCFQTRANKVFWFPRRVVAL